MNTTHSTEPALYARGIQNGVPGMKLLTGAQVREMEPNLAENVCGSLWAPSAGIVSPWELTLALVETAVRNGTELFLEAPVTALRSGNIRLLSYSKIGNEYFVEKSDMDAFMRRFKQKGKIA